jgi:hypothetical protein
MASTSISTVPEPAAGEIDRMIGELEASWKATILGSSRRRNPPGGTGFSGKTWDPNPPRLRGSAVRLSD